VFFQERAWHNTLGIYQTRPNRLRKRNKKFRWGGFPWRARGASFAFGVLNKETEGRFSVQRNRIGSSTTLHKHSTPSCYRLISSQKVTEGFPSPPISQPKLFSQPLCCRDPVAVARAQPWELSFSISDPVSVSDPSL